MKGTGKTHVMDHPINPDDTLGMIAVGLPDLDAEDVTPEDLSEALALYEEATRLESYPGQWPPSNTDSTGLGIARALREEEGRSPE